MPNPDVKPGVFSETRSVEDAAKVLGISRRYGFELARKGTLPGVRRLGGGEGKQGKYLVSKKLLEDWLAGKTVLPVETVDSVL